MWSSCFQLFKFGFWIWISWWIRWTSVDSAINWSQLRFPELIYAKFLSLTENVSAAFYQTNKQTELKLNNSKPVSQAGSPFVRGRTSQRVVLTRGTTTWLFLAGESVHIVWDKDSSTERTVNWCGKHGNMAC